MLFSRNAEENMRATSDRGRLEAAIDAAKVDVRRDALRPGAEARREHPGALDAAAARSGPDFSDFQKTGWTGSEDVHFPEGMTLTPVSVASPTSTNLAVPSVDLRARVVLRPGAHHRHRRPHQQGRRAGDRRAGVARDRRPRDRDASR